jgi:hypothetical protein
MFVKQTVLKAFVLVAVAASATLIAKADILDYTLTGQGLGTGASFSLSSTPTPVNINGNNFAIFDIPVSAGGFDYNSDLVFDTNDLDIDFGTSEGGNGSLEGDELELNGSALLFSGSTAHPTLETGEFSFFGQLMSDQDGAISAGVYTLDVKEAPASPSPAPEPSSVLLLGTGVLALLGAAGTKHFART